MVFRPALFLADTPRFLYSQLFVTPQRPTRSFAGETVIVTGSNVGLGLEAARHLARLNASTLILAVRTTSKGEQARDSIRQSCPDSKTDIQVWSLDLGSYQSVKEFANRCQSLPRLDAIIENAGINTQTFKISEDNESTITTNVVSTILLALLLLPKMRETASRYNVSPRLNIISSDVHYFTDFAEWKSERSIFETLNDLKTADMDDRYNVSKMMEICAVREIAKAMQISEEQSGKPHVILNTANPGLCASNLTQNLKGAIAYQVVVLKFLLGRTTEVGGRTLVAAVAAGEESHGQYMSDGKVAKVAPLLQGPQGPAIQRRVWSELSEKLERIQPGILNNIG